MNKLIGVLLMCAVLIMCVGCNDLGMNKKLALSDAACVTATGATLDEANNFEKTRGEVIEIALSLDKFIEDGKLADLPVDNVRKALVDYLIKKGWSNYVYLADSLMTYVKTVNLPTDKIGANNVLLIHAGLEGIIRQASRSKEEWAIPWSNGVKATLPSATTAGK